MMASRHKPRLLYISPVIPALSGSGLAMRARLVLEALTHHYDAWLLTVPVVRSPMQAADPVLDSLVQGNVAVPPERARGRPRKHRGAWITRDARPAFSEVAFDVIHVFRLAAVPFAAPFTAALPQAARHLDLDELEANVARQITALRRANGERSVAGVDEAQIRHLEAAERSLAEWDRVYVASAVERDRLPEEVLARARVLPNAVRPPARASSAGGRDERTLLFVGNLAYYPNEDAVLYFCREVLPLIRRDAAGEVKLLIAGPGAGLRVQRLAAIPGVHVLGPVEDLGTCYARATAAIVPLRAGGGTRIKVLEAFAHGCPVVTTPVGVEGIDTASGRELLIAQAADAFAEACVELLANPAYGTELASRARALWLQAHTPEAAIDAVAPEVAAE